MADFPKYLIVSARGRGFRSVGAGTPDEVNKTILDLSAKGTSPDNVSVYGRSGGVTLTTHITWDNGVANGEVEKTRGRKKKSLEAATTA